MRNVRSVDPGRDVSPTRVNDVTALLLAGGKSTRFGSDKSRFVVGDRPMVRRVFDAVAPLVSEVLLSVRTAGSALDLPADEVVDQFQDAGPLAGVHAGLARARTPWLLVVACDMPFLTTDAVARLLAERHGGADPIVATTSDGRLQPLFALYPTTAAPRAASLLQSGGASMHAFLAAIDSFRTITLPDVALRNVNTRGDLEGSR